MLKEFLSDHPKVRWFWHNFLEFPYFILCLMLGILITIFRWFRGKQHVRPLIDASLNGLRATGGIAFFLLLFAFLLSTSQVHDMLEGFQPQGFILGELQGWYTILVFLLALGIFGNSARLATLVLLVLNDYAPTDKSEENLDQSKRVVRQLPYIYQSGIYSIALAFYLFRSATVESGNPCYIIALNFLTVFGVGVFVHRGVELGLRYGYQGLKKLAAWTLQRWSPVLFKDWPCKDASFRELALQESTRTLLKDRKRMPLYFLFSFLLVIALSLVMLVYLGSLGPDDGLYMLLYRYVHAVPMLFLGLALWLVLFCAIEMWDVNWPVPVKLMLVVMVLLFSFYDRDHPASTLKAENKPELPDAVEHFRYWLTSTHPGWQNLKPKERIPVVFINIEGGASRSGYWAARVLDSLDTYMQQRGVGPLSKHVYSYSCVSGGNLGAHVFLAVQDLEPAKRKIAIDDAFLEKDMIFPIVYKYCLGEPVLWFTPFYSPRYDRALAIERHLSIAMDEVLQKYYPDRREQKRRSWTQDFFERYNADSVDMPVFMANAAEVETGRRAVLCNVNVPREKINPGATYNIIDEIPLYRPDVAGAIHFSARFPIVSPSARLQEPGLDTTIRHLVDGGVIENEGNLSTDELIRYLKDNKQLDTVFVPLVINILVSSEKLAYNVEIDTANGKRVRTEPNRLLNELTDVGVGIYNARSGHAYVSSAGLRRLVERVGGAKADIDLLSSKLPLNWYISKKSKTLVEERLNVSFGRDPLGFKSRYLQYIAYRLGAEPAPRLLDDIVPMRPVPDAIKARLK